MSFFERNNKDEHEHSSFQPFPHVKNKERKTYFANSVFLTNHFFLTTNIHRPSSSEKGVFQFSRECRAAPPFQRKDTQMWTRSKIQKIQGNSIMNQNTVRRDEKNRSNPKSKKSRTDRQTRFSLSFFSPGSFFLLSLSFFT